MQDNVFEEIKKYTKDDILEALKKNIFNHELLLKDIVIIHYDSMCNKARKMGEKCAEASKSNDSKLAKELLDATNKQWHKAHNFIDKHINKIEKEGHPIDLDKQLLEFLKEK